MVEIVKMLRARVCSKPCTAMTFEKQCDCAVDVYAADYIEKLEKQTDAKATRRIDELEQALRDIAQYDLQARALDALYPHNRVRKEVK